VEASQQPQQPQPDAATLGALSVVLLSGLPVPQMAPMVEAVLAPFGATLASVTAALELLAPHLQTDLRTNPLSAAGHIARTVMPRHAAYALNAVKRLVRDPSSIAAERRYLAQHLNAERIRKEAAAQVDEARGKYGDILGWKAQMDERTTPECAAANGTNFHALVPPAIGYPGTLHGGTCRCKAVAPFRAGVREPARVLVGA
jgi:hypothetical protein